MTFTIYLEIAERERERESMRELGVIKWPKLRAHAHGGAVVKGVDLHLPYLRSGELFRKRNVLRPINISKHELKDPGVRPS